jgi:hypothetical protein
VIPIHAHDRSTERYHEEEPGRAAALEDYIRRIKEETRTKVEVIENPRKGRKMKPKIHPPVLESDKTHVKGTFP